MSNPFQSITPFSQDYASQYNFFESIKGIINELEAKTPIIIESTTVPTQVQMENLYLAAAVGNTLPVPTSQVFIWVNQGIVQGEYRTIDDLHTNINDTSIQALQSNSGFTFLMANGDIIASGQTDKALVATTAIKKYDRRTGLLSNVSLTTDLPFLQFWPSPDGTKLAFSKLDGGGIRQIYTCTYPALGSITQLTTSVTGAHTPCWQNGKISYLDTIAGILTIRIMNENGTGQTTVLTPATGASYPILSPDATKLIYRKDSASGNATDVFMINVNGTGNVKFINGIDYVNDNPNGSSPSDAADCTRQWMIPNWSADGQWILYGRRRKNINTNLSERWFDFVQTNDNFRGQAVQTYYNAGGIIQTPDWTQKNLTTSYQYFGGDPNSLANFFVYIPTFTVPLYGGKAYLISSMSTQVSTLVQLLPAMIASNQADGYKSTGKIYKVSQFIPDRNDFELIRSDVAVGGETTFSVSKSELENFDHIMIVYYGSQTVASGLVHIYLNEDSGANYHSVALLSSTMIERFYSFGANSIEMRGSGANNANISSFELMIYDIKSTDNYKTAYSELMYCVAGAALAITNYFVGDAMTTWKNTAAIESLRIVGTQPFTAGTIISYYGIRGAPRFEKDL